MRLAFILTFAISAFPCAAADWPQWMGVQRDGVCREKGVVQAFPKNGLPVRWRAKIGPGYAGPAVSEGSVFVLDRVAAPAGDAKKEKGAALPGKERLVCLEARTGKLRWQQEWDAAYGIDYGSGPRATPTVHEGRVYVLGAEGALRCHAAADGAVLWTKDLKSAYQCSSPTWGFAAAPLVEGGMLLCLVGGKGSACVAFDRLSGKELWKAGTVSQPGYCPPVVAAHHGKKDVILWTGDAILGLALRDGAELWKIPWSIRYGVSIAGPRQQGDTVLISSYWSGCKMLRLQANGSTPEIVWETEKESDTRTTHLNALLCTPMPENGYFYGVCSQGHLRCLKWENGERRWETLAATTGQPVTWGTAFLTKIGDSGNRWFLFNEKGELILAELSPDGYREISRQRLLEPDNRDCGRPVVWSHPAYADRAVFARNDSEIVCAEICQDGAPAAPAP
jgi:outer membrane protein assembly factor BamB